MKIISVILTILMAQLSLASEILHCSVYGGGPTPGSAIVVIKPVVNGQYPVSITLFNKFYPQGIFGYFLTKVEGTGNVISGNGYIGTSNSNIRVPLVSGKRFVHLYGDEHVAYGFGAELSCE